jgi:hypothetical protein
MLKTILIAIAASLLVSCGSTMPPPEKPKTFVEEVAYWDAKAVAAVRTIGQLTCVKGYNSAGQCIEPGKPLNPHLSIELLEQVRNARMGLRTAVELPDGGGLCLGKTTTPAGCLAVATELLLKVELLLRNQQGG